MVFAVEGEECGGQRVGDATGGTLFGKVEIVVVILLIEVVDVLKDGVFLLGILIIVAPGVAEGVAPEVVMVDIAVEGGG